MISMIRFVWWSAILGLLFLGEVFCGSDLLAKTDFARQFHDSLTVERPNLAKVRAMLDKTEDHDQILATELMQVGENLLPFPPMAHHILNLFMLAKSPQDKVLLIDILSLAIRKGLDVGAPFRDDPPVFFKCLIAKEFQLLRQVLKASKKTLINLIIARSAWMVKFLNLLFAVPTEVVPIAKLMLHVEKIVHTRFTNTDNNRTEATIALLKGARLDKPSVKAIELLEYSSVFRSIVRHIGIEQYPVEPLYQSNNQSLLSSAVMSRDKPRILLLENIIGSLDQLVNTVQEDIFDIISKDPRGTVALSHYKDILSTANNEGRNAFHFLAMSGAGYTLDTIWSRYHERDPEGAVRFDRSLISALTRTDHRNHSSISYCQYRYNKAYEHCKLMSSFISAAGNSEAYNGKDEKKRSADASLPLTKGEETSGGWDTTVLKSSPAGEGVRCDIEEVWEMDRLPFSSDFFSKYINRGVPVIFRGVAHKHSEAMSSMARSFERTKFLRRYGNIKVPASVLPYGDSFGVTVEAKTLREVADSPSFSETNNQTNPLYAFLIPGPQWAQQLHSDVPSPASLVTSAVSMTGQLETKAYQFELQFYLGGAGTGAPVHFHGHAMNTLAFGEKHWVLFPPEQAFYSTIPAHVFFEEYVWNNTDASKLRDVLHINTTSDSRDGRMQMMQCTQKAGDIMYVPSLWAHGTLNIKQSIGVAHEFSVEPFCME